MATLDTILYASQNNGGKAGVSISEIAQLVGGNNAPVATETTFGVVKQSANVADAAVPFADLTAAANAYNALLAALQAAGLMAAS
jgi:hypothetical protein